MTIPDNFLRFTFDAEHEMRDAGLAAADAAATVDGVAKIADVGLAVFMGTLVIDVTAIEVASTDELYRIIVQGSTTSGFTAGTIENLAELTLGATAARPGAALTSTVGRYLLPFVNVQDQITYQYLRVYTDVTGTIATGINYSARIGIML